MIVTFLQNITGGNPKSLIKPVTAAFFEGMCKILPAGLIYCVFLAVWRVFAEPGTPLDTRLLWIVCAILAAWVVVHYLAYQYMYTRTIDAAYNASASGRIALAEHLRKLPLGFLESRDPGDLTSMMINDYAEVENLLSHSLAQLIGATLFPAIAFLSLLFVNWKMAAAMFAPFPVALLVVYASDSLQRRFGSRHITARVEAAGRLQEYLSGMREIKAHNLAGGSFVRLEKAFAALRDESVKIEGAIGSVMIVAMSFVRAGLTLMIFTGTWLITGQELSLPVFLLFLLVGSRVYDPLCAALVSYGAARYAALCAERIMAVRREQPLPGGSDAPDCANGASVAFEGVTFGYGKEDVIRNVSLVIPSRSVTALVGPSGSGKSTLTRLMARFWDVREGRVLLNGADVREISPEKLLARISMVFQDVYLFKDTVRNNIRVGRQSATQEEIEDAARLACCHEFIMRLPQGYDTAVGEGGSTLSGGEKQRISIARALLKDAPLVLLDEATASLDPENEAEVQRAINALVRDKTVVIIAHRLKTVRNADSIVVLERGRVAEWGTHEELLRREGVYSRLWALQQRAEGWRVANA